MKNAIKATTLIFFLVFGVNGFAQQKGQCCDGISLARSIEFNGSSDTEQIKVEVSEGSKDLTLQVNGTIKSGYLTVEIFDPKGNKKGNFSIESQISSSDTKKEMVCGQMSRQIKDPMKGSWIVKLIPKDVVGDITINSMQI